MFQKPVGAVKRQDVIDLVAAGTPEGRHLDYKESLPGNQPSEKKDFLADVVAFANAGGGVLIFGVPDKRDATGKPTGIPDAPVGVVVSSGDAEVRRLQNIVRNGVEPRIPDVEAVALDGFPKGPVIVLRIGQSWLAPHMVTFDSRSRFHMRHGTENHPMDVDEIRAAFLLSERVPERIRGFHKERFAALRAGEAPVPLALAGKAFTVLHIIPRVAFVQPISLDVSAPAVVDSSVLLPFHSAVNNYRPNLDGVISAGKKGYVQLFRNGALEMGDVALFTEGSDSAPSTDIRSFLYAQCLFNAVERYLGFARNVSLPPPFVVFAALAGVRNYRLDVPTPFRDVDGYFDRDVLDLPEVLIAKADAKPEEVLRPVVDALWQSAGFERCTEYSADGSWPHRRV